MKIFLLYNFIHSSEKNEQFYPSNSENLETTIFSEYFQDVQAKKEKISHVFHENINFKELNDDDLCEKFATINNFNYLQNIIVCLFILFAMNC